MPRSEAAAVALRAGALLAFFPALAVLPRLAAIVLLVCACGGWWIGVGRLLADR
jgi:hypothetical protein